MTKVVVAMSMSLDGIAGPESADADGMAIFSAILGWQFPLRSWREEQGMDGGEVDLRCVETIEGEGAVHLRYKVV